MRSSSRSTIRPVVSATLSWAFLDEGGAASIALLVGASWLYRQTQHFQVEIDARDAAVREMERTASALDEKLEASGREADELRQQVESLSEASDGSARRIAQLRRQLEGAPENGDLPVTFLKGARIRSGERRVSIPVGRERIAFVVEVVDATPYARYRLRIVDHETGEVVWTSPELPRRGSVVSLSLPSSAFVGGYYDLFLYGLGDEGEETKLDERYLLNVRWVSEEGY